MSLQRPVSAALFSLTLLSGCGDPAAGTPTTGGVDSGSSQDAAVRRDGRADASDGGDCADDFGDRALGGVCISAVTGQLVDENGAPIADSVVTACAGACFYGMSDKSGRFTVAVDEYIQVGLYSLVAHVNPRRAAFYMPLPPAVGTSIALPSPIPLLPMPASGPTIRDDMTAQSIQAGGVTLTIDAGTNIFFSLEDTSDMPLGTEFRPLRLSTFDKTPFLGGVVPLVLYGFGPFEIEFRKPVHLSFENTTTLAPGTAVEVLGQRGLLVGSPPGARFDVVATAHVSGDGKRIEMDAGTGLNVLTWIALRKKEK